MPIVAFPCADQRDHSEGSASYNVCTRTEKRYSRYSPIARAPIRNDCVASGPSVWLYSVRLRSPFPNSPRESVTPSSDVQLYCRARAHARARVMLWL